MTGRIIHAYDADRKNNGDLIVDARDLGYLRPDWSTLDPTYGLGIFWSQWRPDDLLAHDLDPGKSPTGESVDACAMPYPNGYFRVVVIDGPYKLNGTPDPAIDGRYGVHIRNTMEGRLDLLDRMLVEGLRCIGRDGYALFKCQNQVCSGSKVWQTHRYAALAERNGAVLVDELHMPSYRPQPDRGQKTSRSSFSTLQVFKKARN